MTMDQVVEPRIYFKSLTFSDGTKIELDSEDIVVLVGPNNSGKSLALRELEKLVELQGSHIVIRDCSLQIEGTPEDLERKLKEVSLLTGSGNETKYLGYSYSISKHHIIVNYDGTNRGPISRFFCRRLSTESRLSESNPTESIRLLDEAPRHPIHVIQNDDVMELRLSRYFRNAFGKDLIVYHLGGKQVPLLVGNRPIPVDGEDRLSVSFTKRLRRTCVPLHTQGDGMRSFASVMLNVVALESPTVFIIDEPEAFLHPPQARLMGEFLASEARTDRQVFMATHSADVLQGLLNSDPGRLRIIRMQLHNDVNKISELPKSVARSISADPLLRYSSVLSGVFYKHVFICESDADCMFYSALLDIKEIHGESRPDVLFTHASGKHRMCKLAAALRDLDVPTTVICDIDILNEEKTLKDLTSQLGCDWGILSEDWRAVKKAVEEKKPPLTSREIADRIRREIDEIPDCNEFPDDRKRRIQRIFQETSPWSSLKQGGSSNIPPGQATQRYRRLEANLRNAGLWIVPAGELEGFCRSVEATHGPAWVQEVLENKNLGNDPELEEARRFVKQIWDAVR